MIACERVSDACERRTSSVRARLGPITGAVRVGVYVVLRQGAYLHQRWRRASNCRALGQLAIELNHQLTQADSHLHARERQLAVFHEPQGSYPGVGGMEAGRPPPRGPQGRLQAGPCIVLGNAT